MKKQVFNIIFLVAVVIAVAWINLPKDQSPNNLGSDATQHHILALSWQPAFCENKPNKPECRSQRKGRFDTQNFSLHGLWPQPRENVYCNASSQIIDTDKRGRWNELPRLELSGKLRAELSKYMPGYRSNLHRHEWYKHGTCMRGGLSPQQYYGISILSLKDINKSNLRDLFANNIGKEISSSQISKAMEKSFGSGAGKRISITCKRDGRRTLIIEVKISMDFVFKAGSKGSTAKNILTAPKLAIGCKRGVVDRVGLQ